MVPRSTITYTARWSSRLWCLKYAGWRARVSGCWFVLNNPWRGQATVNARTLLELLLKIGRTGI